MFKKTKKVLAFLLATTISLGMGGVTAFAGETFAITTATAVTTNGVIATMSDVADTAADEPVTVTITLSGTATAAGTHTIGLTSTAAGTVAAPATNTAVVAASDEPTDTFEFSFTMPANAVADLVITNTFAATPPATTYAITQADPEEANGVTATMTAVDDTAAGETVAVTITLSGTATAAGTHTIGLISETDVTTIIAAPLTNTKDVAAGDEPDDTFEFSFTMPATAVGDLVITNKFAEPTAITNTAIAGVTVPVTGATPVTTITVDEQFTGTVTWSPAVTTTFVASTAYTATITLTSTSGYTLTGVTENQFTVAGATTATNSVDSGVVTAVFPATAATTTTTPTTPTYPSTSTGSSSSSGSSSSRSSSSSSNYSRDTSAKVSTPLQNTPKTVDTKTATAIVKDAVSAGSSSTVTVSVRNAGEVSLDTFKAMIKAAGNATVNFNADSLSADGKAVDVRITINPANVTKKANLFASTTSTRANTTKNFFNKYYTNKISVVSLSQQGSFGTDVKIAAKLDSNLNTKSLKFYSYNKETNTYLEIKNVIYTTDSKSYVHFTTAYAGDIVISDKSLAKK